VTAILIFIALVFCTLSGVALALMFADWYSEVMNKPWRRKE
jgi:hypothetical protein